jgi:hypothetical protein
MGLFDSLAKAVVNVVSLPVTAVADVITMGGVLSDEEETYTGKALGDFVENLQNAGKPE